MDARWIATWKVVEGKPTVEAPLPVKGFEGPDLEQGLRGGGRARKPALVAFAVAILVRHAKRGNLVAGF